MKASPSGMDAGAARTTSNPGASVRVRCRRPSVLDPNLPSEPSLAPCVCMPNVMVLYLSNRPIAIIQASSLDQPALERWLACLRARPPRQKG